MDIKTASKLEKKNVDLRVHSPRPKTLLESVELETPFHLHFSTNRGSKFYLLLAATARGEV
jgi:hypothetical protein